MVTRGLLSASDQPVCLLIERSCSLSTELPKAPAVTSSDLCNGVEFRLHSKGGGAVGVIKDVTFRVFAIKKERKHEV